MEVKAWEQQPEDPKSESLLFRRYIEQPQREKYPGKQCCTFDGGMRSDPDTGDVKKMTLIVECKT